MSGGSTASAWRVVFCEARQNMHIVDSDNAERWRTAGAFPVLDEQQTARGSPTLIALGLIFSSSPCGRATDGSGVPEPVCAGAGSMIGVIVVPLLCWLPPLVSGRRAVVFTAVSTMRVPLAGRLDCSGQYLMSEDSGGV